MGWLPSRSTARDAVTLAVRPFLADVRAAATRSVEAGAGFADPGARPDLAARVGGAVCAARSLEQALRDAAWPLPLLDVPPSRRAGDAETRPSTLTAEADAFASLARRWTLALAKSAADAFGRAAGGYVASARAGALARGAPPGPPTPPSPDLVPALASLNASLDAVSGCLDAVAFRAAWRGAVAGAVRLLFNEVATEAPCDAGGAAQLAADAAALAAVLGPHAPRPGAHVRELADAAALLAAPARAIAPLEAALARGDAQRAADALRGLGVARLAPDQAAAVVARRVG